MDYGPFGFIEKFTPLWNMWSGGGEHYSFLNQQAAAMKNFESLVGAVQPLLDEDGKAQARALLANSDAASETALNAVWRRKLGLAPEEADATVVQLMKQLIPLLTTVPTDYTIFWRQLATVAELGDEEEAAWVAALTPAFSRPFTGAGDAALGPWVTWLKEWKAHSSAAAAAGMRLASPKYVAREALLVEAYTAAQQGDYTAVHELHALLKNPYAEVSQRRRDIY